MTIKVLLIAAILVFIALVVIEAIGDAAEKPKDIRIPQDIILECQKLDASKTNPEWKYDNCVDSLNESGPSGVIRRI